MAISVDTLRGTVGSLFPYEALLDYKERGLVRIQRHPYLPLNIATYTEQAVYGSVWDSVTNNCRGLIFDDGLNIIARPFPKFHNINTSSKPETLEENLPLTEPEVTKKMDGSLGILWRYNGEQGIATKGSFTSTQAIWATAWYRDHVQELADRGYTARWPIDLTPLFEIIYPENRIVCSYDFSGLVLIGIVDNERGYEQDHETLGMWGLANDMKVVERQDFSSISALPVVPNEEGYVLTYHTNSPRPPLKVKLKFEDYCALHRVITGLNPTNLWEMLRDGLSLSGLLAPDMPRHFTDWVGGWQTELEAKFTAIEDESKFIFSSCGLVNTFRRWADAAPQLSEDSRIQLRETRKNITEFFRNQNPRLCPVLFAMLDGQDYKPTIWGMIRPKATDTFREDGE